ncbi:hypothetical protein [Olivibacter sp. XZL3]|uniref:hypothetical protein n=1 Tax=Olivibacter sp. XZL3 TaxID=1735116 RepID=UPI0014170459|nr:hypothetical protein [Olivibacter sp. XZL3]
MSFCNRGTYIFFILLLGANLMGFGQAIDDPKTRSGVFELENADYKTSPYRSEASGEKK